jgi:hypothetical protein
MPVSVQEHISEKTELLINAHCLGADAEGARERTSWCENYYNILSSSGAEKKTAILAFVMGC